MIAIIDYGTSNLGSVSNALDRLGIPNRVTKTYPLINEANGLILPGVGAARVGMVNLVKRGLDKVIIDQIKKGKPILGICLGMELLFERSEEGNTACLGFIKGVVKKFRKERKVPQIGWNNVRFRFLNKHTNKLTKGIPDGSYFYFVNSYYCLPYDKSAVLATTEYGEKFASAVALGSIVGVQFHPEKSGMVGLKLLENFVKNYVY